MDYLVIAIVFMFIVLIILFILGLFVSILKSDKKLENDKADKLFWFGLGALIGMNFLDS